MRLRNAGVAKSTVADLLRSITLRCSVAMLDELARVTERVTQPPMGWNKSLAIPYAARRRATTT